MSSLSFLGNTTSYLRIPNADGFDFGTGDFTIEWYQYQTDNNNYPRIFQVGNHPTATIGVSIEGGNLLYWRKDSSLPDGSYISITPTRPIKNQWNHFAICRSSGVTKIFMNGTSIHSMNDTTNFNGTLDLTIGNEPRLLNNLASFGGYIKYFTWVKGAALYPTNFTFSTDYPTLTNNYVLLLTASSFTGTLGSTVVNYNVLPPINAPSNNLRMLTPLFTNNAQVYYKPGSLAPGGVGSVRNSSIKSRRT